MKFSNMIKIKIEQDGRIIERRRVVGYKGMRDFFKEMELKFR